MLISEIAYKILKNGTKKEKLVVDLNNCTYKILVQCDICKKEFETIFSNRKKRLITNKLDYCNSCSKTGSKNSMYGKDRKLVMIKARSKMKQNPMKGKHHSKETKLKMSKLKCDLIASGDFNIKANNRGVHSYYFSNKNGQKFFSDSLLEKYRMIELDNDPEVISWTKHHKIKVPYVFNNQERYCVPDFLIEYKNGNKIIEEVKGRITEQELIKKYAIQLYCNENNFIFNFLTQKELNKNGEYRKFLKDIKNNG